MADPVVPSNQPTTVIAKSFSGDYRIDVLLDNVAFRWNSASPLGTPVEIPYSFMLAPPANAGAEDRNGFSVFTTEEKAATKQILDQISKLINVSFKEVPDTAFTYGIRLGNNIQTKGAGYASLPQPDTANPGNFLTGGGDLYMASNQFSDPSFRPGTYEYLTLVHEIGHAMGLNHPGNYNAGEPASTEAGNFLATSEDNNWVSIMSYNRVPQEQIREFFGTYDMLALKYLYGSKAFNAENSTYTYSDNDAKTLKIINDTAAIDTIDVSASTVAANINLTPGSNSSFGKVAADIPATNNLSIAFDATIENAIGTAFNDTLKGNDVGNVLTGGSGNDGIDGGAGIDTAAYSGTKSLYAITGSGSARTVTDSTAGRDGTDTLTNVERLKFSDENVALDVGGNAGTAAKVLGVIFGASAVSNKQYAGIGLGLVDGGMSYQDLMQVALNFKLGAGFSNEAEIKLLFQTLAGATPSAADLAYWSGTITSNQFTQVSLAVLAADTAINANNIQLTGLAATGLEYSPVA